VSPFATQAGRGPDPALPDLRRAKTDSARAKRALVAVASEVSGEEPVLDVVTARELCARPDPPPEDELLGGIIRRGQRTLLGGYTGGGKSSFLTQTVGAVAERSEFLGLRGKGHRALILDVEQGERSLKRALRERGLADSENVDIARAPDGLALDSDEREVAAVEEMLAAGEYDLVVAEPIYKLHRADSNDERQTVDLMRRFDGWVDRFNIALCLAGHCRKPPIGAKFTIHEFFGSSAYTRGPEVVLGIQRVRSGYGRLHFFKDRDGDLPVGESWGLLFDREHGFRRDPGDDKATPTAPERIQELLEADPGMTIEALIEATGYASRTVRKALSDLAAVSTGKPKRWEIPSQEELL